jgi:hypothetical protein
VALTGCEDHNLSETSLAGQPTNTYSYDSANRLSTVSREGLSTTYGYNGLGDKIQYNSSNGNSRWYALDLNTDLPQIIQDYYATYVYGLDRLGYEQNDYYFQMMTDGLGSVRQIVETRETETTSWVNSATTYDPYGSVIYRTGEYNDFGYAGEFQDNSMNDMV